VRGGGRGGVHSRDGTGAEAAPIECSG
jgi:hypothetical protein